METSETDITKRMCQKWHTLFGYYDEKSDLLHLEPMARNCLRSEERMNSLFSYLSATFSTMALKASGLFMARSASTLRLISIPALASLPIRTL